MVELSEKFGLASRAVKCPLEDIEHLSLPCILHWGMDHFVVLTKLTKKLAFINDPAIGKKQLSLDDFARHFTGVALELTPTKAFKKCDERKKMKISQLWGKITGLGLSLGTFFTLSILLQLFALLSPYFMQWLTDDVLLSKDRSLLLVLVTGFSLLSCISVITSAGRSWLMLRLTSIINMQMGVNLLSHLLRLPMCYFESRHIGDIVSRFGSLSTIQERITSGIVETVIDGLMSISLLIMMSLYSIKLTLIIIVVVALYAVFRILIFHTIRQATEESIYAEAREDSLFLENIRTIQTIKLFTREAQRQNLWQNRYAEVINSKIHLGRISISYSALESILFKLENIIVIYFAAIMVMDGGFTVGMLLAFISYKGQFTGSVNSLINQLLQFLMLRLYLDRVADIALYEQEEHRIGFVPTNTIKGQLSLENISFSYKPEETYHLLNNVSLSVEPGERIVITGASGSGKSTFLKIMLGLLKPTSGRILLDGKDITHIGLTAYRKNIATVMQDDTLFSGSIMDNITFFDAEPNYSWAKKCAHIAEIACDIESMPMGYNTLVGDMGNVFSGGQIQRLLLARAIYQKPKILFLDEATSHLDVRNESLINKNLKELSMTQVVIAHRVETIRSADIVVELQNNGFIKTARI